MEKKKFSKASIASMILCVLIIVAYFLPISTGVGITNLDLSKSFNIVNIVSIIFNPSQVTGEATAAFVIPFVIACVGLVAAFIATIVLFVLTLLNKNVGVRRVLAFCIFIVILVFGLQYNTTMTNTAKPLQISEELTRPGINYYNTHPEFKIVLKTKTGSVDKWSRMLKKFQKDIPEIYTNGEDTDAISAKVDELITYSESFRYDTKASINKKANTKILNELKSIISEDQQEEVFNTYFKTQTKSVNARTSSFGAGFVLLIILGIALSTTCYSEKSKEGYKNNGIRSNCMFVGIMMILLLGSLLFPIITVNSNITLMTGMTKTSLLMVLFMLPKLFHMDATLESLGLAENVSMINTNLILIAVLLFVAAFACMVAFTVLAAKRKAFTLRRVISIVSCITFVGAGIVATMGLGKCGIGWDIFYYLFSGISIAMALLPFTVYTDKEKYKVFSVINVILFLVISSFIVVPLWKVFVDSLDATAGYGMRMWPENFTLQGYYQVISNVTIRRPFIISVVTTLAGTFLGLLLSTLGAYVLIQFEMPGRNFLAGLLLFTMIFQGGMIPTYLVMSNLHLTDTIWSVILLPAINVYNLVLMRNFFEGIPKSLFESAAIDGCTPMGIFVKIVLPLSKAALASIGLMFAVSFWNDYTNYKLYIKDTNWHNFQMKLRALMMSSDMPTGVGVSENTLQNAAIMVAILPFMIIYPFCQNYFVKGVNIGAVKE